MSKFSIWPEGKKKRKRKASTRERMVECDARLEEALERHSVAKEEHEATQTAYHFLLNTEEHVKL